jgi:acetyltransferase-like isoleucine patch superfamily enzyme
MLTSDPMPDTRVRPAQIGVRAAYKPSALSIKWFGAPHRLTVRILNKLYSTWIRYVYPFGSIGEKVSIHYTCDIRNPWLIEMGNKVIVDKDVWLHPILPLEDKTGPTIILDDGCYVARRCQISARNCVHIERDVLLSASVLITDNSHHYENTDRLIKDQGFMGGGRVRIGEGCWIGHGAAIVCTQGELVLGRNCVVAANAVVTRSFPANSVISGNPARVVRQYDPAKAAWVMGNARAAETSPTAGSAVQGRDAVV